MLSTFIKDHQTNIISLLQLQECHGRMRELQNILTKEFGPPPGMMGPPGGPHMMGPGGPGGPGGPPPGHMMGPGGPPPPNMQGPGGPPSKPPSEQVRLSSSNT